MQLDSHPNRRGQGRRLGYSLRPATAVLTWADIAVKYRAKARLRGSNEWTSDDSWRDEVSLGEVELNAGRKTLRLEVANRGRPIQVGSHYHFYRINAALAFDREK